VSERADVVVIGGGIVGAAVTHELAAAGVDVTLVERSHIACGSSGKPIGGVRGHFSDALNVSLAARSLARYAEMADDIGLDQVGYLFLLREPEHVAGFERSVALQNDHGMPARMISTAEAVELCPLIDRDAFIGAALSPADGHARPVAAATRYLEDAMRHGARIHTNCGVTGIDVRDGEIAAVETEHGTFATPTVVCAAGAWSREIGAMAGVALEIEPLRRQIVIGDRPPGAPARLPFTIDYASTFYFHSADDDVLLGMSDPAEQVGFDTAYAEAWLPTLREAAAACAPTLAGVPMRDGWAGLYEMTPDHNALIGESPDVSRFLYATGFSGHGFCQAPATGEIVRDLVLGREPCVDVRPLRAERCADSAPVFEANIV
jgi:sarcosine oxidase subunit beta